MNELLSKFCRERQLSSSTIRNYTSSVKIYEKLNKKSLDELIYEAEMEEIKKIRWKNRKIKKRLVKFRNYLYETKVESTANRYLTNIKTIYRHFEIELQNLPYFNSKQVIRSPTVTYKDLPTNDEIKKAYYEADDVTKIIILFITSSGCSKVDLLNLTVNQFLNACSEYTSSKRIKMQLNEIKSKEIVPTFYLTRQKTKKDFVTFCTPRTAQHIADYLLKKENIRGKDVIFDVSPELLTKRFQYINDFLGFGYVGNYSRLRCHMLRKYHATNLLNNTSFSLDEIDTLQGRSKNKVHRAYFFNDSEKLRKKYLEHIDIIDILN